MVCLDIESSLNMRDLKVVEDGNILEAVLSLDESDAKLKLKAFLRGVRIKILRWYEI